MTPPVVSFLLRDNAGGAALVQRTRESLELQSDGGWEMLVYGVNQQHADMRAALDAATGDVVCLLNPGYRMAKGAVSVIRSALLKQPQADVLYADEAVVDGADKLVAVVPRPRWSPEFLRGYNFLRHLLLVRAELLRAVLSPMIDSSEMLSGHDLALRATEQASVILHLPHVLVARPAESSKEDTNPGDGWASVSAVQAQLDRLAIGGAADSGAVPGTVRVKRVLEERSVAVVIATEGRTGLVWGERRSYVLEAVRSLMSSPGVPHLEVVVVHTSACPTPLLADLREVGGGRVTMAPFAKPARVPQMINHGVVTSNSDIVVMLDERTEVISSDFLAQLASPLSESQVGLTGPLVRGSGDTLVGTGLAVYADKVTPMFRNLVDPPEVEALAVSREVSALDHTCLAIGRDLFESVGGLNESLATLWGVDLSFKVAEKGLNRLWVEQAQLFSFGPLHVAPWPEPEEKKQLMQRWQAPVVDDYVPNYGRRQVLSRRDDQSQWTR